MKEFVEKLIGRLEKELSNVNFEKATKEVNDSFYDGLAYAYGYSVGIALKLAEEYNNGWIPCSERLPEYEGNYLVQQDDGRINILHYCKGWNCTYMDVDKTRLFNACERKDIIAWQPLPAPFKKGE